MKLETHEVFEDVMGEGQSFEADVKLQGCTGEDDGIEFTVPDGPRVVIENHGGQLTVHVWTIEDEAEGRDPTHTMKFAVR